MEENKNIKNQPIARSGASGSAKMSSTDLSRIINENVAKSIDESISKLNSQRAAAEKEAMEAKKKAAVVSETAILVEEKPEAMPATEPTTEETAEDIFGAVYREKKIQQEHEQITSQDDTEDEAPVIAVKNDDSDNNLGKNKKFNVIIIAIVVAAIALLGVACAYLFIPKAETPEEPKEEQPVENILSASLSSPFSYQHLYGVDFPQGMKDEYKLLYSQNQDFVGWLTIPETSIDMPVYQCENNSYYLKHDNYDTYTKYGTLFMDMYNDPMNLTRNTTIYGHNFDNKQIFDELHNYQNLEFFKKVPVIEFNTLYKDYKWKVIAAFHTNGELAGDNNYLFYYIASNFGDNSFMKFYDELQQRSYIHTGVDVQPTDKILTLSTCTYFFDRNGALENARFVVVARLVRDGESEEVDVSKATENDNVRYPQLYYDVFGGSNPWRNASRWQPESN